jgi:O-antigen/teichoic acid export membrane protein
VSAAGSAPPEAGGQGSRPGSGGGSRLAHGIASNWTALIVNVAISFFLAPFVVNKLGSVWYGIWAVTMQFIGYLYLFDFGVRESVIRYTSKYAARGQGTQLNKILTVAFSVYGVVTLLALAASALLAFTAPHFLDLEPRYHADARWTIALVGATIAQTFIFNVFSGVVLGLQRWVVNNVIGIVIVLVRTAFIVVALDAGHGIVTLAVIQLGTSLASGFATWILASRYLRESGTPMRLVRLKARQFRALASRVFRYGFFVFLSNIGQKIIVASDAIIIATWLPVASVTYYAIAGSLIDPLRSLLASTAHVFAPVASNLHALGKRSELGAAMVSGSKLMLILALPVGITFVVLGSEFIRLWMGAEFAVPSGQVLAILGVAVVASTPSFVTSMVLYGISRHNLSAYLKIAEAVVNLVLCIILVRKLGIVGVAIGAAVPHIISSAIVMPWIVCRAIGFSLARFYAASFTGPLLASVPFALILVWMRGNHEFSGLVEFFAAVAGACLVYALSVFLVALDARERGWVLGHLRRARA